MATIPFPFRSAAHRGDLGGLPAAMQPYPFLRWFALVSAAAILFVLLTVSLFLSRFVEDTSLSHDAEGLTQLIRGIVEVEGAKGYFLAGEADGPGDFEEFLVHLAKLPGVLRTNVYSLERVVLWSSDPSLIGRHFPDNRELDEAFAGRAVVSTGRLGSTDDKPEHARLGDPGGRFVENYLPVWSPARDERRVIGVIEVYRTPVRLFRAIDENQQRIWWAGLGVATLLYAVLFVIVARAARMMTRQQAALVAAEKLATAGEMASAVAHGLRNPLASIRSTAELGLETGASGEVRELLSEVVTQADRLEGWIRQFLTTAREGSRAAAAADLYATVEECVAQFRPTLDRHAITLTLDLPRDLPPVGFSPVTLRQVLNSVIANALEAMTEEGRLRISALRQRRRVVVVEVADTGPGMTAAEVEAALSPFATTKPAGLGLGLPLARETLERQGGRLEITSQPGAGTRVRLVLPVAPAADGRRTLP